MPEFLSHPLFLLLIGAAFTALSAAVTLWVRQAIRTETQKDMDFVNERIDGVETRLAETKDHQQNFVTYEELEKTVDKMERTALETKNLIKDIGANVQSLATDVAVLTDRANRQS